MMLEYIGKTKLNAPIPNLEESRIAEIMQTNLTGTQFHNVGNINSAINSLSPSVELIAEYDARTLDDIRRQLQAGLPVAVWIRTADASPDYAHSVVITGIDDIQKLIYYNDPTYGVEKTLSQTMFLEIWDYWGSVMIKAEIGRRTSESMERYFPKGNVSNEQS